MYDHMQVVNDTQGPSDVRNQVCVIMQDPSESSESHCVDPDVNGLLRQIELTSTYYPLLEKSEQQN
jgi:hypothetical protein